MLSSRSNGGSFVLHTHLTSSITNRKLSRDGEIGAAGGVRIEESVLILLPVHPICAVRHVLHSHRHEDERHRSCSTSDPLKLDCTDPEPRSCAVCPFLSIEFGRQHAAVKHATIVGALAMLLTGLHNKLIAGPAVRMH